LRELTNDLQPPAAACATWRALYAGLGQLEEELMEHIHLENNVLFPRALTD
jgi:regulator of cell morphogenesis and NO signaling